MHARLLCVTAAIQCLRLLALFSLATATFPADDRNFCIRNFVNCYDEL